ncbi:hypothetical protein K402DRAFT_325203 [Aulographum hederae CBS 113979]|uniref:EthD domain-containing protein n=1 Tax=Aulographum hederae CBS 113979 TaxID=1176131 RepID=A0A6G1HBI1_9PEZI|nr:hypothetical protein K402DRAFT_325203 [Aulographum hederae CBS 113979]
MTHKKLDYSFRHEQLSYDAKPNYQPCLKLQFFFSKLPDVSYEQFHRHWETVHADLTVATNAFKEQKVQRYVQFHALPEDKERAKKLVQEGCEFMDFDGSSEIWVKDWEGWEKFAGSEEYARALGPDTVHFMAMPIKVMAGRDNVIYGAAVPEAGAKDGIQEWK